MGRLALPAATQTILWCRKSLVGRRRPHCAPGSKKLTRGLRSRLTRRGSRCIQSEYRRRSMALTAAQKVERKEARKLRDRAYRERYNARKADEDAGNKTIAQEWDPLLDAVRAQEDSAIAVKDAELAEIERQLGVLQDRKRSLLDERDATFAPFRAERDRLWAQKNLAQKALEVALNAKYPDLR